MIIRQFGRKLSKASAAVIALGIGVNLAMISVYDPTPIKAMRNVVFDSYQRIKPRLFNTDMPARIVDIDDESLAKIGQWPWPRTIMADLIDGIGTREAAAIGLDIILSEPDRTSPERVLPMLPPSPERDALAKKIEAENYSNDRVLAGALEKYPIVAGVVLSGAKTPPPVRAGFAAAGDPPLPFLPKFTGAVVPLEIFEPSLKGFGALNWVPEYDQVVRRVPTVLAVGEQMVPSLAMEALRVAQDASTFIIKSSNASGETAFGAQTGVNSLKVGQIVVDTEADASIRLRYAGSRPERRIPAWKILANDVPKDQIEGRIVFVGSSASALADLRASPLDPVIPGVEVHAEVVEHVLSGNKLSRPDWAPGAEVVLIIVSALIASAVGYVFSPVIAVFIGMASVCAAMFGSWYVFKDMDVLLDPSLPSLSGMLAFGATTIARWRTSDSEKKAVRRAFSHYLSPAMVERLSSSPEQLILGGEQRVMTLLFSDVRGFTALSEAYKGNPQALTQLMNRLLTPLTNAIVEREGTIDKYMGDAIMAFWNAPLDVREHAHRACEAALAMRRALTEINSELADEAVAAGRRHAGIEIGIGINTGDCVVGNMGSEVRFDYSVLGDPVNLASRLEGQTKSYGVNILIGQATEELVRGKFALAEVDLIRVKGKTEPQRIFSLMGDESLAHQPSFTKLREEMAQMLAAYRQQRWDDAERFAASLTRMGFEYPVGEYVGIVKERIARYRVLPPPHDWDGAYNADTK